MHQMVPKCPAVLSIIGWHAGESPADIIQRKRADIQKAVHHHLAVSVTTGLHPRCSTLRQGLPRGRGLFFGGRRIPCGRPRKRLGRCRATGLAGGLFHAASATSQADCQVEVYSSERCHHPLLNHEIDLWEYFEHSTSKRFHTAWTQSCHLFSPRCVADSSGCSGNVIR